MLVYPAVDIAKGRCVRLSQGKADQEKVYCESPSEAALHWQQLGAQALHLVNLDAALGCALHGGNSTAEVPARAPAGSAAAVLEVLKRTSIPVQVAGGLRSTEAVEHLLDAGAARAVVGTRAAKEPDWAIQLCGKLPGRVVIAVDARQGRVAIEGWQEVIAEGPIELARRLAAGGPAAFLYTDVSRDGMLTRPDFEGVAELVSAVDIPVIASGGVASLDDIRELGQCGADAVIVGKALYEGRFALPEALEVAAQYGSRLSPSPLDWRPAGT